jgi:hypothetical protein
LRIRDVAGNVFQGVGIRPQARDGRGEGAEDTHDIFSKFDPGGQPMCKPMAAIEGKCRKRCARL